MSERLKLKVEERLQNYMEAEKAAIQRATENVQRYISETRSSQIANTLKSHAAFERHSGKALQEIMNATMHSRKAIEAALGHSVVRMEAERAAIRTATENVQRFLSESQSLQVANTLKAHSALEKHASKALQEILNSTMHSRKAMDDVLSHSKAEERMRRQFTDNENRLSQAQKEIQKLHDVFAASSKTAGISFLQAEAAARLNSRFPFEIIKEEAFEISSKINFASEFVREVIKKDEPNSPDLHQTEETVNEEIENQSINKIYDAINILWMAVSPLIRRATSEKQKKNLWAIFLSLATSVIFHYGEPLLPPLGKSAQKKIQKEVACTFKSVPIDSGNGAIGNAIRFVKVTGLSVRSKPTTKGTPIALLKFGSIVRIKKAMKGWAYVRWTSADSDEQIEGWVSKKYLMKFK